MKRLRDLDLKRHLGDPALKAAFVTPMFDLIAPRYDAFTRLFSFGMDASWKRALLAHALTAQGDVHYALDLACGTGDLAFAVAAARRAARVAGVDASQEMLVLARARVDKGRADAGRADAGGADAGGADIADIADRVRFLHGDLSALPASDRSADLITCGYGFRNANFAPALRECARVLRPRGVLAVLDFYRPQARLWRTLFLGYLRAAGNIVGWWWHREPVVYGYIAHSIDAYISAAEFTRTADSAGFDLVRLETHLGGGVAIHILRRR